MQIKHNVWRAATGLLLSAATLLAGGALTAVSANAAVGDQTRINVAGNGTITIKKSQQGRTFTALRLAQYDQAASETTANGERISGISLKGLDTATDPNATAINTAMVGAINAAGGPDLTGTEYANNPMQWIAGNWLGYPHTDTSATPNGDSSSNISTGVAGEHDGQPYSGKLRDFVSKLQSTNADFKSWLNATGNVSATADTAENPSDPDTPYDASLTVPTGMYIVVETGGDTNLDKVPRSIPILIGSTFAGSSAPDRFLPDANDVEAPQLGTADVKTNDGNPTKGPDINKGVALDPSNPNDTVGQVANPTIGNNYEFVITGSVPQISGYSRYTYEIADTPTNALDLDTSTDPKVTVDGTTTPQTVKVYKNATSDAAPAANTINVYETVEASGHVSKIRFVFDMIGSHYTFGKTITITYKMKLTSLTDAHNGAQLTHSTDSDPSCVPSAANHNCGDMPAPEHKVSFVPQNVHLFNKKSGTTTALKGAAFTVYKDGQAVKFTADADKPGAYRVADSAARADVTEIPTVTSASTGSSVGVGEVLLEGLDASTYTIKQVKGAQGMLGGFLPKFSITITGESTSNPPYYSLKTDVWGLTKEHTPRVSSSTGDTTKMDTAMIDVFNVDSISALPMTGGAGAILVAVLALLCGGVAVSITVVRKRARLAQTK